MATATKRMSIFKALFGSGIDVEYDYSDVELTQEQKATLLDIDKKAEEIKKGFNSGKSSKGGITPKINPDRLEAMRSRHDEVAAKQQPKDKKVEYEIGD